MSIADATMTITVKNDTEALEALGEGEIREWIFTFGYGQQLVPRDSSGRIHDEVAGMPLPGLYVRIKGTFMGARRVMQQLFGQVWCEQYETEEAAGVELWGLREIPLPRDVIAWLTYEGRRPE